METQYSAWQTIHLYIGWNRNKLYSLCSIGKPSPAEFRSAPFSRAKDTYNLTWLVESYPALDEVRLLYRKVMVSSLCGLTFWLVLNKSSHQKSSSRQRFLVNLLIVSISKLNLSRIKIKSLNAYHSVFVYLTQSSPNISFDTMICTICNEVNIFMVKYV